MDGTFLGAEDFAYGDNLSWVSRFHDLGIPVVLTTIKTAAEILHFRQLTGVGFPAIVENGGGYLASYEPRASAGPGALPVQSLSRLVPDGVRPLSGLPREAVVTLLGLTGKATELALARPFCIPVLPNFEGEIPSSVVIQHGSEIGNLSAAGQSKVAATVVAGAKHVAYQITALRFWRFGALCVPLAMPALMRCLASGPPLPAIHGLRGIPTSCWQTSDLRSPNPNLAKRQT